MKRKKKTVLKLIMWDFGRNVVFNDRLESLRIPNDVILSMSVEFFNDPEPCQIHRSACMARAFAEIEMVCGEKRAICELPDGIRRFFGLYNVEALCVTSDEKL